MTRNPLIQPLSILLLAGLVPASSACAQFVSDEKDTTKAEHTIVQIATNDDDHKSSWTQKVSDGEHVYELKSTDGVFVVKIDDEQVPSSWIHEADNGAFEIINGDGENIFVFKALPQVNAAHTNRLFASTPKAITLRAHTGADEHGNFELAAVKNVEQPKVMLGINLSEPSEALRAQLGLGDRAAILIDGVMDGLPAAASGMLKYDVVVSIDGSEEASGEILHKALMKLEPGDKLKMIVIRAGKKMTLKPELVAYDNEKLGQISVRVDVEAGDEDHWISDDGELQVLVEQMRDRDLPSKIRLHKEMTDRAHDALEHARAQIIELRDGQLFVREHEAKGLKEMVEGLHQRGAVELQELKGEAQGRMEALEARLNTLEARIESQASRLEERMEQLTGLLERMFEKMGEDDE